MSQGPDGSEDKSKGNTPDPAEEKAHEAKEAGKADETDGADEASAGPTPDKPNPGESQTHAVDDAWGDLLGDSGGGSPAGGAPPVVAASPAPSPGGLFAPPALEVPPSAPPTPSAPDVSGKAEGVDKPEPPEAEKPEEEKPEAEKPESEKPESEKPEAEKPEAEEPESEASESEKPESEEEEEKAEESAESEASESEKTAEAKKPEPQESEESGESEEADESESRAEKPQAEQSDDDAASDTETTDDDASVRKAVEAEAALADLERSPDRSGAFEQGADVVANEGGSNFLPYVLVGVAFVGITGYMAWSTGGGGSHDSHDAIVDAQTGLPGGGAPTRGSQPSHFGDTAQHGGAEPEARTTGPDTDAAATTGSPTGEPEESGETGETGEAEEADGEEADGEEAGTTGAAAQEPEGETPEPESAGAEGDPRAVPEGTPAANARAFKRIPVAVGDKAPVGGVGKTGIHVDEVALGSEYTNRRCAGKKDDFSVEAGERATVCLRVVHNREDEEIVVTWQKDGKTVRRSKLAIKAAHAIQTRAFLALRPEYVGDWTMKVESVDGAQLARAKFRVVD